MLAILRGVLLAALVTAQAQASEPLIRETAVSKISEHVHVISDLNVGLVPNVGIIVGTKATETAQTVQAEFQARYPQWAVPARIGIIARTAYVEAQ